MATLAQTVVGAVEFAVFELGLEVGRGVLLQNRALDEQICLAAPPYDPESRTPSTVMSAR